MWIILVIIILVVGLAIGAFGFANIIYPLFVAWPKAKRLEKEGKLIKPIPVLSFILAPIVWTILVVLSIWLINRFVPGLILLYLIELGIIFIYIIVQIPRKNRLIDADFEETWKSYLKEN